MFTNPNERGIRNNGGNPGIGLPHHNQPAAAAGRAQVGELTYGRSPASGPAPTTAGHHSHDLLNKLDPRVDSTHDSQAMPSSQQHSKDIPEGTYGPHHSRLANALDPRVDSDMDSTGRTGAGPGVGGAVRGAGMHSAPGHGGTAAAGYNAADPRNDLHQERNAHIGERAGGHIGPPPPGGAAAAGHAQPAGTMGDGFGAAQHHQPAGMGGVGAPAGPHKSSLMNKLDPRVDSKTGMTKDGTGSSGWTAY